MNFTNELCIPTSYFPSPFAEGTFFQVLRNVSGKDAAMIPAYAVLGVVAQVAL
eukprot:Awhi_evm1s5911